MDFGVWGPSKENMNQSDSQRSSSQPFQTASQPNSSDGGDKSGNNNNNGNGSNDDGVVLMHHMEHTGVVCDICDTTVCGFRYKCMQCPDFDLCHFCERKGHHAGHIMMRISFPEQAAEAIRRYISSNSSSPSRPPPFWGGFPTGEGFAGHGGHHRHGHHGGRHSARNPGRCGRDSSPENPDEPSGFGHGCPYQVSKKGMKKWAKCMKKAAHHHRRSAEAYSSATAAAAAPGAEPTPNNENTGHGFDFTAAASQIQEFLNAWGVPIDVVELYDELGNRGQPSQQPASNSGGQNQETAKTPSATTPQTQTTGATTQNVLTEQLQQLNINSNVANETIPTAASIPQVAPTAPNMDTVEPGWTLIDKVTDGSINRSIPTAADQTEEVKHTAQAPIPTADILSSDIPSLPTGATSAVEAPKSIQDHPQHIGFPSFQQESIDTTVPITPTAATVNNSIPIYPPLNAMQNPQFQQMMQGVTNAVGSAIRNIPILPMGLGSFPRPQQPGQPTAPAPVSRENGNSIPELDAQSVTTLNQLLSMGFSNHDGWLARLVVAKKGDLEAVLNALFPGGAP